MNEEMKIYEENETTEMEVEVYEEPDTSSNGIVGKLVAGAVIVGVGAVALIHKNKDKLEARKIRKLEKKGYVITKPVAVEESKTISEESEETQTEEK